MKITFHIHELGRLKNTSFDFHNMLIFTGDSNLGKSYAAFLVHGFFRLLEDEESILTFCQSKGLFRDKDAIFSLRDLSEMYNAFIERYLQHLVGNQSLQVNVSLSFEFPNLAIQYKIERDTLDSEMWYSSFYTNSVKDMQLQHISKSAFARFNTPNLELVKRFQDYFIVNIKGLFYRSLSPSVPVKDSYFFPPSRAAVMGFNFSHRRVVSSLGMYEAFLEDLDRIISHSFWPINAESELATQKIQGILNGQVLVNDGDIRTPFIYNFRDKSIPLVSAASSIKELSPLALLLKGKELPRINLLFEEPEAHLHPKMQQKLAQLLAYMVQEGAFLQLTTHSDYMLGEWNNLLRLFFIKQKSEEKFQEAVEATKLPADCALNPEYVGAYYFSEREDGSVEMIKSEINEQQQIAFDSFGEASEHMGEIRYQLIELLGELIP